MKSHDPKYHNYNAGRVGYDNLRGSAIDPSRSTFSLDQLMDETDCFADSQDEETPSETWFRAGLNRQQKKETL